MNWRWENKFRFRREDLEKCLFSQCRRQAFSNQWEIFPDFPGFHCIKKSVDILKSLDVQIRVKDERIWANGVFSCPQCHPFSGRRIPKAKIRHRSIGYWFAWQQHLSTSPIPAKKKRSLRPGILIKTTSLIFTKNCLFRKYVFLVLTPYPILYSHT